MFDFEPHSWEMPCDSVSDLAATLWVIRPFDGRQIKWELRLVPLRPSPEHRYVRVFLWFRPLPHNTGDAGFVACEDTAPILLPRVLPLDTIRSIFTKVLADTKFGRIFFLNSEDDLRRTRYGRADAILISASGTASWSFDFGMGHSWNAASFKWGEAIAGPDFLQTPADVVWKELQTRITTTKSEAALSRLFARLNHDQRYRFIEKWPHGDEDAMKVLLKDILRSQALWEESPDYNEFLLKIHFPLQVEIFFKDAAGNHPVVASPSLLSAVKRIWQWFEPFDPEVVALQCVREWMRGWMPHRLSTLEISAPRPTAHERLEAHLRWRDWLTSTEQSP